MLALQTVTFVL